MKVSTNIASVQQHVAHSFDQVKIGVLYRTSNGSIVVRPRLGVRVPSGFYMRIVHGINPSQNMSIGNAATSNFPWTALLEGTTVELVQE